MTMAVNDLVCKCTNCEMTVTSFKSSRALSVIDPFTALQMMDGLSSVPALKLVVVGLGPELAESSIVQATRPLFATRKPVQVQWLCANALRCGLEHSL